MRITFANPGKALHAVAGGPENEVSKVDLQNQCSANL